MIYVNMSGRCGNQLFFYAIARRVQELSNRNDKIVFVFSEDCKEGSYGENSLNDFQIKDSITIYEKYKKDIMHDYRKYFKFYNRYYHKNWLKRIFFCYKYFIL